MVYLDIMWSNILNAIQSMDSNIRINIEACSCNLGFRQGDSLSSVLFSILDRNNVFLAVYIALA